LSAVHAEVAQEYINILRAATTLCSVGARHESGEWAVFFFLSPATERI
jgi:hypothetical protein